MSAEHVELAARMPWTVAQDESMWVVSGTYPSGGTFTDCLAIVVPSYTGAPEGVPLFQLLVWGRFDATSEVVPASSITRARELILVDALDPLSAYYEDDQATIDIVLDRRDGVQA